MKFWDKIDGFSSKTKLLLGSLVLMALGIIVLPMPDHQPSYSHVVYSSAGELLSATISDEQQWCLPSTEPLPDALVTAIITYEDRYFYYHPGVNPISIMYALKDKWANDTKLRGASTITMQLMRMRNKNAPRTIKNKLYEMATAVKYTLTHTKSATLLSWASIAPFGGNTIGFKTAALRYFGRDIDQLSWAEYALLAVMPNGPSSASLTYNKERLVAKRNFLLAKLYRLGRITKDELDLALSEDLPTHTKEIPQHAYHFLSFLKKQQPKTYLHQSTLNYELQLKVQDLVQEESNFLQINDIDNAAAIVVDINTNELLTYVGNTKQKNKFSYIDISQSYRSYGSLLKPLLYAYSLDKNYLLPHELIADIPTTIGDFSPMNFDRLFRGAVPMEEMIIQSLNVPAVRILNTVGIHGFYRCIDDLKIGGIDKGVDHYGLGIILGGAESSLWELGRVYKGLAQNYIGKPDPFRPILYLKEQHYMPPKTKVAFSPYAMKYLVEAMSDLTRPREEKSWQRFGLNHKIAWKTGTSHGHKDAWAIGFNGNYMVAVWIGNETGEGHHDLTGLHKASPLLFKIFNTLPSQKWFGQAPVIPSQNKIKVCNESGKQAGPLCKHSSNLNLQEISHQLKSCDYHQVVTRNAAHEILGLKCIEQQKYSDTIFLLPSFIEYYYKPAHQLYKGMQPLAKDCFTSEQSFSIIYPEENHKIFLPKTSEKKQNQLICKAYHFDNDAKLYWFIDEKFVSTTSYPQPHECRLAVTKGKRKLTITDHLGNKEEVHFEVISE